MLGWKTEGRFMGKQAHTKKLNRKHSDLTKIRTGGATKMAWIKKKITKPQQVTYL